MQFVLHLLHFVGVSLAPFDYCWATRDTAGSSVLEEVSSGSAVHLML